MVRTSSRLRRPSARRVQARRPSVASCFKRALRLARPLPSDISVASDGHQRIRRVLDTYDKTLGTFLTGSYKRRTYNHPLNDVDIFWVTKTYYEGLPTADAALHRLARHLRSRLGKSAFARVRVQAHSLGITIRGTKVTFDIIPSFIPDTKQRQIWPGLTKYSEKTNGQLLIPSGERNTWIATFPVAAHRALVEADRAQNGFLRPLIRLLKCWNSNEGCQERRGRNPFKSFHLECLAVANSPDLVRLPNVRIRFARLLERLAAVISDGRRTTTHAPGIPQTKVKSMVPVSEYMFERRHRFGYPELRRIICRAAHLAQEAVKAEGVGKQQQAHTLWTELLGPVYESPSP